MEKKINNNYDKKFKQISKYLNPDKDYSMEFLNEDTVVFLHKQKKLDNSF